MQRPWGKSGLPSVIKEEAVHLGDRRIKGTSLAGAEVPGV